ncbi:hypothetical protein [Burkholderia sp. BCC1998]|uniref:hypothetical protein n=1 Tax=Burkholderia sp. BCC1998 TaxID=2817447 RepID=UPI002AB69168|nr:hypothetical protein [Burkholderia sp. BCC1998]
MSGHYQHIFVLMQRVQDALIKGYTGYQIIRCDEAKAAQLKRKFAAAYETEISKQARWRRRRAGLACAKFLTVGDADGAVTGFLMVTAGAGLVMKEPLLDPSRKRITIAAYELIHDGVGWSWRFTAEAMKQWRSRLHSAIASADTEELQQLVRYLYRTAGFRLVRRQVGELAKYIRGEWRRLRRGPPPELPSFLPYVRRLPDDWTPGGLPPSIIARGKRPVLGTGRAP